MKTCCHPTCTDECRRVKAPKKIYHLKRTPIRKKTPKMNVVKIKISKCVPVPKLLEMAQLVFNRWIRNRDQDKPCISGGRISEQAGHCFAAGSYSGVRFDEINVNGQSVDENCFKSGNFEGTKRGIMNRYGYDQFVILERRARETKKYKWSREELNEIINRYKMP